MNMWAAPPFESLFQRSKSERWWLEPIEGEKEYLRLVVLSPRHKGVRGIAAWHVITKELKDDRKILACSIRACRKAICSLRRKNG